MKQGIGTMVIHVQGSRKEQYLASGSPASMRQTVYPHNRASDVPPLSCSCHVLFCCSVTLVCRGTQRYRNTSLEDCALCHLDKRRALLIKVRYSARKYSGEPLCRLLGRCRVAVADPTATGSLILQNFLLGCRSPLWRKFFMPE